MTTAHPSTEPNETPTLAERDASVPPSPPSRSDRRSSRWSRRIAISLAVIGALVLAGWMGLRWITPHPYSGTVMQAPTAAPSMDGLVLSDGTPLDIADFEGELLLVYFGYTSCPDVCPTTLSQVAAARRRLGGEADRVRLLMISIDPERDSLDVLGDYVTSFDPSFLAATGDLPDVERVAAQYGIFFAKGEELGDGYAVDHTATLMGIDPEGHLRIIWPAQLDVERLAADFDELL
jgi:protein SCO1/2